MRVYAAIVRVRSILLLQYKLAAFTGVSAQLVYGFVRVMVFYALYRYSDMSHPMTYAQVVTYIWIGQAYISILPWGGEPEIEGLIRTGNVAYELCRPIDVYNQWFSRSLAYRIAPTLLRATPMFIVGLFLLPPQYAMEFPPSPSAFGAWALATAGAVILSTAITNLANVIMLWTISGEGIVRLIPAVVNVFSGILVPIPLFPEWAQRITELLPFRGLVDTPIRFYLGHIDPGLVAPFVAHQLVWSAGFILLGRWLLRRRMRYLMVQGG